jgi:hypothetical protein
VRRRNWRRTSCCGSWAVHKTPLLDFTENGQFAASWLVVLAVPRTMCFFRHGLTRLVTEQRFDHPGELE